MGLALSTGAAAQDTGVSPVEMAAKLRAQQAQLEQQARELERQRLELERQRGALAQQQKQLEALIVPLEAQMARQAAQPAEQPSAAGKGLSFEGYADVVFRRFDFYENAQDNEPEKRGQADLARFVLAPRMDFGGGWSFGAEIEFEHGGTGSTVEYEADEAGEFETEIEKGGEIVLEQMWLQYSLSPALNFRVGELVVPVGMVNSYHQPTQYFGIGRSVGESAMLPVVWHETGFSVQGTVGQARYQLQLVTALDSTGFSGFGFVKDGTQRKMEFKNASAMAIVAQAEYAFAPGIMLGGAFYTGDSAPNRPRQNLDVAARVTLAEIHGRYEVGPVTVRGQWLEGRIQNADAITAANLNTFNGDVLGTSRTPVGSRAQAYFVEAGYNLLPLFGAVRFGRLDAFARYDFYDTHAGTEGGIVRNPRYRHTAVSVGLNYKPQPGIVFKAELSHGKHDGTVGSTENVLGVAAGFEF